MYGKNLDRLKMETFSSFSSSIPPSAIARRRASIAACSFPPESSTSTSMLVLVSALALLARRPRNEELGPPSISTTSLVSITACGGQAGPGFDNSSCASLYQFGRSIVTPNSGIFTESSSSNPSDDAVSGLGMVTSTCRVPSAKGGGSGGSSLFSFIGLTPSPRPLSFDINCARCAGLAPGDCKRSCPASDEAIDVGSLLGPRVIIRCAPVGVASPAPN
mmetsp:Transcript_26734/g.55468  ORF Transcript_26734/g.55468 Transcript_26734/m.55468 type:complete len:219 (-) Transcript_26734:69-725(-)